MNFFRLSSYLMAMGLLVLFSCKKEPQIVLDLHSFTHQNQEIFFDYSAYNANDNGEISSFGFYMGTTNDPKNDGVKLTHGDGNTDHFTGTIGDLEKNTTYYIQLYADYEGLEYRGNVTSVQTTTWKVLDNTPTGDFRTVAVSPNGDVHIAGTNGDHYYSHDEGFSWTQIPHNTTSTLTELKFIDANVVFMRAENEIMKSADGGATWVDINTQLSQIQAVFFYDESTFYVAHDDTVYATHNGGAGWLGKFTPYSNPGSNGETWDMHFLTADIGYSISWTGYVRKTTDGGNSWDLTTTVDLPGSVYNEVWFFNEDKGIASNSKKTYLTIDGGQSWDEILYTSDYTNEIFFLNDDFGMLLGDDGVFMQTDDGALNWKSVYNDYDDGDGYDVELVGESKGYAVRQGGLVLKFD